jgi:hypothetical protein
MKNKKTYYQKDFYATHFERIKANIKKFDSGEWNKYFYSHRYKCQIGTVEIALNQVMMERLQQYKWENTAEGWKIDDHYFINIPDVKEIEPIRTIEHGDKIELIYESKMNVDSN